MGPVATEQEKQKAVEKPITRQQRRFMARAEADARQTLDNLTSKFLEFFTDADEPEGQEVVDKMNSLSAQWKVYCHRKNLKKEAYSLVENYCKGICEQYLKAKDAAIK